MENLEQLYKNQTNEYQKVQFLNKNKSNKIKYYFFKLIMKYIYIANIIYYFFKYILYNKLFI